MQYQLITTFEQLEKVCTTAQRQEAIALDTEFVRTRTLTPHLGLIQLYDGHQLVLIDPLAIENMQPFVALLENTDVVKVLHSCSEDLETFLTAFDTIPTPIFDTQFAASVLGKGPTLGYAKLVEMLCDVELDKGESRTDWLARPLREAQLSYAANDVLYLLPCYQQLASEIQAVGKADWVFEEIALLGAKKRAQMPEDFAYLQIKNSWRLNAEQLTVLQALAAWRLNTARKKDLALNFVFKEGHLFEAAQRLSDSKSALSRINGVNHQSVRRYGDTIVAIIEEARTKFAQTPEKFRLPVVLRLIDIPKYKKTLAELKSVSEQIADENGVSSDVIASKKQLNQLLKWYWFQVDETRVQGLKPDVLSTWRAPLFQPYVSKLLGDAP
ncbi:ribonuclease D [Alteromonas sp. McT4-15]|jgi:ribonuclease D|uniref:ribonuclease D n=1 Tax=unclassified Alteromonas TaxID=2614992 RepID=UPI001CF91767|nr:MULTISPECIES: ribonuclease D [unclassified Alteromonas]MCB4436806.1 ribonuclease D [Alteromonas sp. McT4-15]WDT84802.1 ribonuclease D [Alteromonas sp. 009811495]